MRPWRREPGAFDRPTGRRRPSARLRPPRTLRPTRAGWTFFAITFGVGFAALNTGNNLLYLVLSLMLAFLTLSGFLSELALRGVAVERHLPREVFAGIANRVELSIRNSGVRTSSYALMIEDVLEQPAAKRRRGRRRRNAAGRSFVLRITPLACERRAYLWTPPDRGSTVFEGFVVSTRFPFALFVKSMEIPAYAALLVYPAIESMVRSDVDGPRGRRGEASTGGGIEGAEISSLREFTEGDSARRIHWRSSIRRGELFVGEIEPESDAEIEVLLRTNIDRASGTTKSRRIAHERFEERVRWAASEVVAHLEAGRRVALRSDALQIPPGTGAAHRARLLTFLATVQPGPSLGVDPGLHDDMAL